MTSFLRRAAKESRLDRLRTWRLKAPMFCPIRLEIYPSQMTTHVPRLFMSLKKLLQISRRSLRITVRSWLRPTCKRSFPIWRNRNNDHTKSKQSSPDHRLGDWFYNSVVNPFGPNHFRHGL